MPAGPEGVRALTMAFYKLPNGVLDVSLGGIHSGPPLPNMAPCGCTEVMLLQEHRSY